MKIDNIDNINKTFSLWIEGNWRCAFSPGEIEKFKKTLLEKAPDKDHTLLINEVESMWTEEVVLAFKNKVEQEEGKITELMLQAKIHYDLKQELKYAEEQAWIENIVRDLIKQ